MDALERGAEELLSRYRQTAEELRAALGLPDAAPTVADKIPDAAPTLPDNAPSSEMTKEELAAKLRQAADCLLMFETERAGEILNALRESACEGKSLRPAPEEICRAVDDFETETAREALETLLEKL